MNLSQVKPENRASAQLAEEILYKGLEHGDLTLATRQMNEMIDLWVDGKRQARLSVRKYAVETIENYLTNGSSS